MEQCRGKKNVHTIVFHVQISSINMLINIRRAVTVTF